MQQPLPRPATPHLDRAAQYRDRATAHLRFLAWLAERGYRLADVTGQPVTNADAERLVAAYFRIDLDAARRERAALDAIRCPAAREGDDVACSDPRDAVTVRTALFERVACVHHAAVIVACMTEVMVTPLSGPVGCVAAVRRLAEDLIDHYAGQPVDGR